MSPADLQGAMMSMPCVVDADCPASLVCYDSSLSWTGNQSYCLCSTWYGWTLSETDPESCDMGPDTIVSIAFYSLIAVFLLWELAVLSASIRSFTITKMIKRNMSVAIICAMTMGWIISTIARLAMLLVEFSTPQIQVLLPFGAELKYSPLGLFGSRPLLVVMQVFGMLVDLQLIPVWLVSVKTMSGISLGHQRESGSEVFSIVVKVAVVVIELGFLIAASLLVASNMMNDFLFACIAFLMPVLIGYILIGYRLDTEVTGAIGNDQANIQLSAATREATLTNVAASIRFTATVNALLILMGIGVGVALAENTMDFKERGSIPMTLLNLHIFLTVCQIGVVTRFIGLCLHSANCLEEPVKRATPLRSKVRQMFGVSPNDQLKELLLGEA